MGEDLFEYKTTFQNGSTYNFVQSKAFDLSELLLDDDVKAPYLSENIKLPEPLKLESSLYGTFPPLPKTTPKKYVPKKISYMK